MSAPQGAPGWRELRAHRIARQQQEQATRRNARSRPRRRDVEEDEEPPARRREKKAARSGKASAVVTREQLKKQRSVIERVSAWLVLLLSFLGSIAMLHGGFAPMIASIRVQQYNIAAILGGILIQAVVTFLEWYYFDAPWVAWGARIVDTATTAIGYGPLFLAPLSIFLVGQGIESPQPAAWAVIVLVSLGVAWFPESRLVD